MPSLSCCRKSQLMLCASTIPVAATAALQVLGRVKALGEQPPSAGGPAAADDASAVWEAQSVLLLWLSILILIPFQLSTVDAGAAADVQDSAGAWLRAPNVCGCC